MRRLWRGGAVFDSTAARLAAAGEGGGGGGGGGADAGGAIVAVHAASALPVVQITLVRVQFPGSAVVAITVISP